MSKKRSLHTTANPSFSIDIFLHPSAFIPHPSAFILQPSSIIHHPSSFSPQHPHATGSAQCGQCCRQNTNDDLNNRLPRFLFHVINQLKLKF